MPPYRLTYDAGVALATYTYGATNERLISDEGGIRTYYAWSGGAVVAEYSETAATPIAPQWQKNYIYLGNRLLATQVPTSSVDRVEFHHPDRLGTRLSTNSSDTSVTEQVHLPFGTALPAESTQQLGNAANRRFTSYDRSGSTGLDYAVNRHYDSVQGRFSTVDPIGMRAASLTNPQTLNMYAYVGNDPVNNVDPDGLFFGGLFRALGRLFTAQVRTIGRAVTGAARNVASSVASAVRALPRVVASEYGQLALAIALTVLFPPAGATLFAAEVAGREASIRLSQLLIAVGVHAAGAVAGYVQDQGGGVSDCSLGGSGPCEVGDGGRVVINVGRPPSPTSSRAGAIAIGVSRTPLPPLLKVVVIGAIGVYVLADILRNIPTGPPPLAPPTVNIDSNIYAEKTADELIPNSLKGSPSYSSELGGSTRAELEDIAQGQARDKTARSKREGQEYA